jgi:hypothetical protein
MMNSNLRNEKLEPRLRQLLAQPNCDSSLPVIVQTFHGVDAQVLALLKQVGGTYKDDLRIIKGFTADLAPAAIEAMILSDLIKAISYDADVTGFGG